MGEWSRRLFPGIHERDVCIDLPERSQATEVLALVLRGR